MGLSDKMSYLRHWGIFSPAAVGQQDGAHFCYPGFWHGACGPGEFPENSQIPAVVLYSALYSLGEKKRTGAFNGQNQMLARKLVQLH